MQLRWRWISTWRLRPRRRESFRLPRQEEMRIAADGWKTTLCWRRIRRPWRRTIVRWFRWRSGCAMELRWRWGAGRRLRGGWRRLRWRFILDDWGGAAIGFFMRPTCWKGIQIMWRLVG